MPYSPNHCVNRHFVLGNRGYIFYQHYFLQHICSIWGNLEFIVVTTVLDSQLREHVFECCAVMSNIGQICSQSCVNEYLGTDSSGYVFMHQYSCISCRVAGYFPEKSKWCSIEHGCQGVKCIAS